MLHNPASDRRNHLRCVPCSRCWTAAADDKKVVPLNAAKELLRIALNPPQDDMIFPFSSQEEDPAKCWVSLMLRPVVCPAVEGYIREKSMEVRFFAPGGCVANLDFVESIFGNGGDPFLAENDAGLDIEHWTGHTGCVIVAPHLAGTPKQVLNLPTKAEATEREIRDGMYYEKPDDLYNDGGAFKLTFRDASGMVVTVIADNYFGYCKKRGKDTGKFLRKSVRAFRKRSMQEELLFSQLRFRRRFDPQTILLLHTPYF